MKKFSLISIISMVLILSSGTLFSKDKEFIGYLCDKACAKAGISADIKANLITNPEKHTVMCMKDCKDSGFGLMIKQSDGKYKFYKFDENGDKLALSILNKTKKTDNIKLKVNGSMMDEMIMVKSMMEKK